MSRQVIRILIGTMGVVFLVGSLGYATTGHLHVPLHGDELITSIVCVIGECIGCIMTLLALVAMDD
jgi:hypothetical protein